MAQIICDRVAGGHRQWKAIGKMRLGPGYPNDPIPPVYVVEPKLYDLGVCNDKFGSRVTTNEMAGFHGSKRKR
ncbi:hypothetical protein, partial [Sphingobium sp. MK2]|uniref:hypothetical protein n=1 Tax=Sphingobium sp. MK2 TaxID=3116540 RepID=UPI0032E36653